MFSRYCITFLLLFQKTKQKYVHFITVSLGVFISPLLWLLFFQCSHFTNFCYRVCFFSCTSFLCCCTASATALGELFFTLRRFLPYTPSRHLAQPVFIRASLGPEVQPWKLQGLLLRFETQTRPICLFELPSVQQKVLVGWFYLCIKDLRNTIINSFRFWTY